MRFFHQLGTSDVGFMSFASDDLVSIKFFDSWCSAVTAQMEAKLLINDVPNQENAAFARR